MGNYYFTSCADGSKTKVEYTFGYKKNADGKDGVTENGRDREWEGGLFNDMVKGLVQRSFYKHLNGIVLPSWHPCEFLSQCTR